MGVNEGDFFQTGEEIGNQGVHNNLRKAGKNNKGLEGKSYNFQEEITNEVWVSASPAERMQGRKGRCARGKATPLRLFVRGNRTGHE
jgi:hypothetical protein